MRLQARANLVRKLLHLLWGTLGCHLLRRGILTQDLRETLHAPALKIDGDLKVAAYLLAQGINIAALFLQQVWIRPARNKESAYTGIQLGLGIVVVGNRRHQHRGGHGADVLLRGGLLRSLFGRFVRRGS